MAENINPKYKEEVIHAVEYHYPKAKIILFGSRALGNAKEGSDIDIAIDNGTPIPPHEISRIRATMENLRTPLFVDVVDLQSISAEFKEKIEKDGIVWKN